MVRQKSPRIFYIVVCIVSGLLRGAAVAHGAGHDDAHDTAGAHMGATGNLHPGLVSEGRGSDTRPHERGRGLLRSGRPKLRGQDCRGRAHDTQVRAKIL